MAKAKYKRGNDGWFKTYVWDGTYNENGTKHRKQLRSNKSSADLEKMVNKFKRDVAEKRITKKTDTTFYLYAKEWAALYKANNSINTIRMYNRIIECHIRKQLEGIRLVNIERKHLQQLINSTTPYVGRQCYLTVKQVVKSAITDQYLPINTIDMFDTIKPPKAPAKERRVLMDIEIKKIKTGNFLPMDKAFLLIIYGCGLRRGETLALTRFDIDFKRNEISVNKSLAFDENNPVLKGTKSASGVRRVPMPPFLVTYLHEYLKTFSGSNLFWTNGRESMTRSSYNKMWKRIQTELGSPDLTAHIFRHNYCTSLCYQIPTVSIKKIAQLLGDRENMVMNVYNHIVLEREDAAGAVAKAIVM